MLIDVHSHYLPKDLARSLEQRVRPPRIVREQGSSFIECGEGSKAVLTPVFSDPDQILERMDEAGIDHAVLSVTIPGVDWLGDDEAEQVAEASNLGPRLLDQLGLSAEDRAKIEHENAVRLFGIHVPARRVN